MHADVARVLPDCGAVRESQGKKSRSEPWCCCGKATDFTVTGKRKNKRQGNPEHDQSESWKQWEEPFARQTPTQGPWGRQVSLCESRDEHQKQTYLWRAVGSPAGSSERLPWGAELGKLEREVTSFWGSILFTAACRPDPRLQRNHFLLACLSVCDSTPLYGDSLGPDLLPPFPGCWNYKHAPLGTAPRKDFWQNLLVCVWKSSWEDSDLLTPSCSLLNSYRNRVF